jgi:hypothetical protein
MSFMNMEPPTIESPRSFEWFVSLKADKSIRFNEEDT